ncbi:cysteine desulfurase family protein (TIGR01976 family) [Saccharopolyspora erythraea NRRL 2338]|uniref:Cysteine desulfurase n=2 Tax=Saccharopolyspora erythraea TaxID=1836 RepID=A4FAN8_SACEN|nr:cysteine desulfurase-like protein [Saccharopolyspora erythraea]EQD82504.1 cysteine desulfurase [Saccharopolyspora erythraea D]PFG94898.1 cysteine desulfurase family protein (TIGR01976 family) [Saccharopolyspora erythraea NRRL 2338]QRK91600.1 cysteine desulfurase-like protein [Saccharopolyspora erythraea]CAM01113.1 cysteine desulfurase [Saccharopolyspora erythraea NRRL 2338]
MAYDVEKIRAQYPALSDGRAWLDGAAGTQVPQAVIDAVADAYRIGVSNQGGPYESSRRAGGIVAEARAAVADLVGAPDPACVVFGPSMTALTYRFASVLAAGWRPGDEVVVTRLDHDANFRPWVQAARRAGATVRVADIDPDTGELSANDVVELIGDRTRLVAVTAASNLLGIMPDLPRITERAAEAGALSYVDGVQHCPHARVRIRELGADLYATSAYKWAGPHLAAVVAADHWTLETLHPDKLAPSPDTVPDRFELGTNSFEAMAGVTAAVRHLAELDSDSDGSRVDKLDTSRRAVIAHEEALRRMLFEGLDALGGVKRYGPKSGDCTPTAFFTVRGLSPSVVADKLAARGVNVSHGHSYAWETVDALGLGPEGGVRASLSHYSTAEDVRRLLEALGELTG